MGERFRCKVPPTEAQLKHAAFVLQELSASIPQITVPLRTPNVVQATRALQEDEAIDLSLLAVDITQLPSFDGAEVPTPEAAALVVDAMFRMLGVSDNPDPGDLLAEDTNTPIAPSGESTVNMIENDSTDESGADSTTADGAIDLSILDH